MPRVISKDEAIARLSAVLPEGVCSMCKIVESEAPLISAPLATLSLNRFPLRWGHLLVVTRRHVTSFAEVTDEEHAQANALVLRGARALERRMRPARVFTASLGTARAMVPMSSPHLHWHVVPVASAGERPSEVLSWSNGVYAAEDGEWEELAAGLARDLQHDVGDVHSDP